MRAIVYFAIITIVTQHARGTVTLFYNYNQNSAVMKQTWLNAVPNPTVIDFTGFPAFTILNTQYASRGILFTDGTDRVDLHAGYLEDGAGLNGSFDESTLVFTQPTYTLAFDYPGDIEFSLYSGTQLVFASGDIPIHGAGLGLFVGIISDQPFDRAMVSDAGLFIDNIYFSGAVPLPGSLALMIVGGASAGVGRRRRS